MTRACPDCGSDRIVVLRTRTRNRLGNRQFMPDGAPATTRRLKCSACGHRWTLRTATGTTTPFSAAPANRGRHFSDDEVVQILTSIESHPILAARFGVTPQTISAVRLGRTYAKVRPDLPRRRGRPSCWQCVHWASEACGMGFPDPETMGPGFAAECALFTASPAG